MQLGGRQLDPAQDHVMAGNELSQVDVELNVQGAVQS